MRKSQIRLGDTVILRNGGQEIINDKKILNFWQTEKKDCILLHRHKESELDIIKIIPKPEPLIITRFIGVDFDNNDIDIRCDNTHPEYYNQIWRVHFSERGHPIFERVLAS